MIKKCSSIILIAVVLLICSFWSMDVFAENGDEITKEQYEENPEDYVEMERIDLQSWKSSFYYMKNYSDDTMISDDNIFDYRNISEDSNVMEKSILKSAIIIGNKDDRVRDIDNPLESFRNATIKCWYTDRQYKAVIVSASGKEQGRVFEDGVGYLDEEGMPYSILEEFLQTQNAVGNPKRFHAYHYDFGEVILGSGKPYERKGRILEFASDEYISLYRIDIVNDKAKENCFGR